MSAPTWTLLLTKDRQRHTLKLSSEANVEELYRQAEKEFGSVELLCGFPPRPLAKEGKLKEVGIVNQDRITVKPTSNGVPSDKTASLPAKRTKRAAAQRATDTFAATIAAQEALQRPPQPKKKKANNRKPQFQASRHSEGRRLEDGAVASRPRRKRVEPMAPEVGLLESLESKNKAGRLMRKGWRQAVESAYEQNQAAARVAGLGAAQMSLQEGNLEVTYPKGLQGRGSYQDVVDYLSREVLQSVVKDIHPSEALRPSNLSLLSPRVFWSLVYHCQPSSIEEGLQTLHPDLDWSFLRRRRQQLSAKARENLRQQQQEEETGDLEAAAQAIARVEEAMENLTDFSAPTTNGTNLTVNFEIVTPTEEDVDELITCIDVAPVSERPSTTIAKALAQHNIPNWRVLANQDPDTLANTLDLEPAIVTTWIERAQQESLEEIMVEVCDGNVDAVELLREHARGGTPKDLAMWATIPSSLWDLLREHADSTMSADDAARWSLQARAALDCLGWLQDFVTPVLPNGDK